MNKKFMVCFNTEMNLSGEQTWYADETEETPHVAGIKVSGSFHKLDVAYKNSKNKKFKLTSLVATYEEI